MKTLATFHISEAGKMSPILIITIPLFSVFCEDLTYKSPFLKAYNDGWGGTLKEERDRLIWLVVFPNYARK